MAVAERPLAKLISRSLATVSSRFLGSYHMDTQSRTGS
jgi:hypothetical protein